VLEAAEAAGAYEATSLDAPTAREDEEGGSLIETLGREDGALSLVGTRKAISDTWGRLPEIEREVLRLRFTEDLTQSEIGERVGYSQMHVSRLLRRALKRLEAASDAA
jgi:RNA polymerase sigma-B factor